MFHDKVLHTLGGASPLLAKAEQLAPLIASKGAENDATGRLQDDVVSAMRDAGFFGLMVPAAMGGMESNPVQVLSVVEAICRLDGATGWVMMAANVATASAAAFLPDAGYRAIFEHARPIIAGAGAPTGRADVEGDGYRLTGHWTYGSGCLHCDYVHAGAIVHENGAPRMTPGTNEPEARIFVFPAREASLLGNWDVLGLRGTGSIDYAVKDLFVPGDFTHLPSGLAGLRGGDSYRVGVVGFSALGHTGFALGHGRHILDELAELVHAPTGRPTSLSDLGGSDSFKEDFAAAEGKMRAARALCYDVWSDVLATTSQGQPVPLRQITWARVALNHATTAMMEVAIFAHRASGGVGLRAGTLQRLHRDAFTATQHLMVADRALREAGRDFLGLAQNVRWTPRGLVPAA